MGAVALGLVAIGAQAAETAAAPVAYVVLGEQGARVARVITTADRCPSLTIDGASSAMGVRAAPATIPQRPTRSDPANSKPSVFDALVCEAIIPQSAHSASLEGRALPLPPPVIERIVLIGDTGCRVKQSDKAYQACNDPKAYPFAQVAASAARWKPDLVIHVGDYLYRENACPGDQPGCAGGPWGYGLDAWRADFFTPATPLMKAAAWVAVRGNHESCDRAGQGWWRLVDPRPLIAGRDCNAAEHDADGDFSDPYAVGLGRGAQVIVFDSSNAPNKALTADDPRYARYRDTYAKIATLAQGAEHSFLADHHPMLAFAAQATKSGEIKLYPGNAALQSAFASLNPNLFPAKVDLLLSGHVHVWEALSFSSGHPGQLVTGFSGTQEDIVPLPATLPPGATPAPGAVVEAMSSWVNGFGFMTLERRGADRWLAQVRDVDGKVVNRCQIDGAKLHCDVAQVGKP